MGLLGAGLGAFLGARGGWLWALIGAVVGSGIEDNIRGRKEPGPTLRRPRPGTDTRRARNPQEGELAFLGALSAMLAKMAKADGRVSEEEIHCCEQFFDGLALRGEKRAYCVRAFRRAKDDDRTIYDYARAFVETGAADDIRQIVYGILWDVACADGEFSLVEQQMLRRLPAALGLDPSIFAWEWHRRGIREGRSEKRRERARRSAAPSRPDPYATLGCTRSASDGELRRAYREKAKRLHPDILRAQGLSDELMDRANDQMARINAAWDEIRRERGL